MAHFKERDAHCTLTLSLGHNEFRRVFNSQISDVQNCAGSCSCSVLSPVAWVIRDAVFWLPHKKCISLSFKYYSLVLTSQ